MNINARTLFEVPEGSTQDCKAVTFTKETLTYIKKKHGIDNDVNVVVSSVGIDSDDDPNVDELFNHIISDEGWDQRAQCKMIIINHAPISNHIGYAFVFNDKDGKRAVLLSKDEESEDGPLIGRLRRLYESQLNILSGDKLRNGPGCWIFAARMLTDMYKLWVFASKDLDKEQDPNIRDKIIHAKQVRNAQLELFQEAIDNKSQKAELVPAFRKLRQSTRDLPESHTDVGILHEKKHTEFRKRNFSAEPIKVKQRLNKADANVKAPDRKDRNTWVSKTLERRKDSVPIPSGIDHSIY